MGSPNAYVSRDRRYPNPAAGVDRRREPAPEIHFLTFEDIDEQLEALKDHPSLHAMVATLIYAGLRREELTWLTTDDVDLDARLIRVRAKTISGKFWQPKTKKNRAVPISDALFAILKEYRRPYPNRVWFFPAPKGKRWDVDNFSRDLGKANKAHGLKWACLHFRHTFGSQLAQKGESLYKISALMGNSPEICRRHYAAIIPEKMADVVEFAPRQPSDSEPDDDDTKALLAEILQEVRGRKDQAACAPRLRLIRSGESA